MRIENKPFLFIGESIISEHKEFKIFQRYKLKKANSTQVIEIKRYLLKYFDLGRGLNPYELEISNSKINSKEYVQTTNEKFTYWIIELEDDLKNIELDNIELALILNEKKLTVLSRFLHRLYDVENNVVYSCSHNSVESLIFYENMIKNDFDNKTQINDEDVINFNITFNKLNEFKNKNIKFNIINKALNDYKSLKEIRHYSPFRILGYFTILELLLTTYKPNENSLNNQLQTKINLINNFLEKPVNFRKYFKGSNTDTLEMIIQKMYLYRNDIAHGNQSDFEKKLVIFKNNQKQIEKFLDDLVKKILIFSLDNTQMIIDLKKC